MASNESTFASSGPAPVFSYAQAIKGKTAIPPPSTSTQPPTTPPASLQSKIIPPASSESVQAPAPPTESNLSSEERPSAKKAAADADTAVNAPQPVTEDGSDGLRRESLKEDERRSERTTNGSRDPSKARSSQSADSSKKSKDEPSKSLKEAPPPAVNFWAQRSQKPAPIPVSSKSADAVTTADITKDIKPNKPVNGTNISTPETKSSKTAKQKPPAVQDTISWPTPETAQTKEEEQRKKSQDKPSEKPEQAASARGKNEWVAMPFTPSVKFNTPMPDSNRRGGRAGSRGGRGGRGGLTTGRGGTTPTNTSNIPETTPSEAGSTAATTITTVRGRSDSTFSRSNSIPPKNAKRTPGGSQSTTREASGSQTRAKFSTQGQVVSQRTSQSATPSNAEVSPHARVPVEAAVVASQLDVSDAKSNRKGLQARPIGPASVASVNGTSPVNVEYDMPSEAGATSVHQPTSDLSTQRKPDTARPNEGNQETGTPAPRERGEGKSRGNKARNSFYGPSHISTNHTFGNGFPSANPQSAKTGSFPPSSSQYFASNSRSFRGGPRSASIPGELQYPRFPGFQDFGSGGYESFQYPAVYPYPSPVFGTPDQMVATHNLVAGQMNYYFSLDNLIKDTYLRRQMDSQGFVPLTLVGGFKRIKDLTTDLHILRNVCASHPQVELRTTTDGKDFVRARHEPLKWVLNMDERDPSARHDGPEEPDPSQVPEQHRAQPFPVPGFIPNNDFYPPPFAMYGQSFAPAPVSSPPPNGNFQNMMTPAQNRASMSAVDSRMQSPAFQMPTQNGHNANGEDRDAFPDESLPGLMVYSRPKGAKHTRSESGNNKDVNGTKAKGSELLPNGSDERRSRSPNTSDASEWDQNRKLEELRKSLTTSRSRSKPSRDDAEMLFYTKESSDENGPSSLPQDSTAEPYEHLHARALHHRELAPEGQCPHDLYLLYDFWAHFLVRNFNTRLYNDFRKLAHEDAFINKSSIGMTLLISFYTQALKGRHNLNTRVARHFVELVQNEDPGRDRPAFKQLRGAWRDGATNLRNRKVISDFLDEGLKHELDR